MTFVSATPSQGSCSHLGGTVTCSLGTIAPAATVNITIVATANTPGAKTNSATVSAATSDPNLANNTATATTTVQGQVCGNPGNDGSAGSLSGIINAYRPGTATAVAGSTSISVGAVRGSGTIAAGDMLMVMQMQDAAINSTNTDAYGDGTAGDGNGSGSTNLNNTGRYEFVIANGPVVGGVVSITGTGAGNGLLYTYTDANATPTQGQRRFQVIRVPQYTTATVTGTITASPWDGSSGGVVVADIVDALALNGNTINVNGLGFRGAGGLQLAGGTGTNTSYRALIANNAHALKGEGIAGRPRYVWTGSAVQDLGTSGYPNGDVARGAPGNAGGGGNDGNPAANDENSGGGGGGNGSSGGIGGNTWASNLPLGGFGGGAFPAAADRFVLGGGGGAGTRNNSPGITGASSGAAGGGIIIIRAGSITGGGTVSANGSNAFNGTDNDGGGGGGAGGSIFVATRGTTLSGMTITALGGNGGDAWITQAPGAFPGNRHGPGGGGAGGAILLSDTSNPTINVAGGSTGRTTTALDPYGSNGGTGAIVKLAALAGMPGVDSGTQCTPTAILWSGGEAFRIDDETIVTWQTGFEVDNFGFQVWGDVNGQRVLLTPTPVAGSALVAGAGVALQAGAQYTWITDEPVDQFWIEEITSEGSPRVHGPIRVSGAVPSNSNTTRRPGLRRSPTLSAVAARRPAGDNWSVTGEHPIPAAQFISLSADLSISAEAKAKGNDKRLDQQRALAAADAVKIGVSKTGLHRVSQPALVAAGLSEKADPKKLQMFVGGEEIPILVTGSDDRSFDAEDAVLFYGESIDIPSTGTRTYWLIEGKPGARIDDDSLRKAPPVALTSFRSVVSLEERLAFAAAVPNGDDDSFYGPSIGPWLPPARQILELHSIAATSDDAIVDVVLQGSYGAPANPDKIVAVTLNGNHLGTIVFDDLEVATASYHVPNSMLREGSNELVFTAQTSDFAYSLVDKVSITYSRRFESWADALHMVVPGHQSVRVSGFTSGDVQVFDVTDSRSVVRLEGTTEQESGAWTSEVSVPGAGERVLFAVADTALLSPELVVRNTPSTLADPKNRADMIIVTRRDFSDAAAPLVARRASEGIEVQIVDIEDIYDEFAFGVKDPAAIRELVAASKSWRVSPRWMLLLGRASADPRNYMGFGESDFVPTQLVHTTFNKTASDDLLGDIDGDGLSDIAIGRMPAGNAAEAATMIDKVIRYETGPGGPWSSRALFVTDQYKPADGNDFPAASTTVESDMPSSLELTRIALGPKNKAAVRSELISSFNDGRLLVNYMGHGSMAQWTSNIYTAADARNATNGDRLSTVVALTCLSGWFIDPTNESMAEAMMRNPNGGAAAVWASSGLSYLSGQVPASQSFYANALTRRLTLGEAVMNAKTATTDDDVRKTWILFGDPSMKLRQP